MVGQRKGIETFVKSAKYIPKEKLVVVGKFSDDSIDHLKSIAPPNVKFTGFVSDDELINLYQKAKVVCQLSYYEAFGLSPAEGMACNCIPVVTKQGGLIEVAGDAGFFALYGNEKETANAIENALNSPKKSSEKARDRILKLFNKEHREKKLIEIIEKI